MLRLLAYLIALLPCSFLLGCGGQAPSQNMPMKPPLVLVSQPVYQEVIDYEDFTGRMEALKTVEVRARATGYLQRIHFKDGTEIAEGQLLFEIDARTYQASLAQSEANLRQAKAHLKRMNADYRRAESLLPKNAISREEFDKIAGDRDEAEEAVGVAIANRDVAQINLDYTRVLAPISGRISRRFLDVGNMVKADDTSLTRIVDLDSMYVSFDINERTLLRIHRLIKEGKMPSAQGSQAQVLLRLADEKDYTHRGIIDFEDNQLDPGTGTHRVRAVVPNHDRFFTPNLFVRVRLPIGLPHRALLISEQALGTDQGQKFVYVINDKSQAEYRPVEVGRMHEGLREITGGLKPGEIVIVRGLQRIRPGTPVTIEVVKMPVAVPTSQGRGSPQAGIKPGHNSDRNKKLRE